MHRGILVSHRKVPFPSSNFRKSFKQPALDCLFVLWVQGREKDMSFVFTWTCIWIPAVFLTRQVTSGPLFCLPEPQWPHLQMGITIVGLPGALRVRSHLSSTRHISKSHIINSKGAGHLGNNLNCFPNTKHLAEGWLNLRLQLAPLHSHTLICILPIFSSPSNDFLEGLFLSCLGFSSSNHGYGLSAGWRILALGHPGQTMGRWDDPQSKPLFGERGNFGSGAKPTAFKYRMTMGSVVMAFEKVNL